MMGVITISIGMSASRSSCFSWEPTGPLGRKMPSLQALKDVQAITVARRATDDSVMFLDIMMGLRDRRTDG
jgi:hypothetical protein